MPSTTSFHGSCACERISYDCLSPPQKDGSTICHCTTCRKLSGGPYQVFIDTSSKDVIWYDNTEHLRYEGMPVKSIGGLRLLRLSSVADRACCVSCGSWLAMRYDCEPNITSITLGTVDMDTVASDAIRRQLSIGREIYCDSRVPWLRDAPPDKHYVGMPPGFDPFAQEKKVEPH